MQLFRLHLKIIFGGVTITLILFRNVLFGQDEVSFALNDFYQVIDIIDYTVSILTVIPVAKALPEVI